MIGENRMTGEEVNPIVSEDYADLLIEYYGDFSVFNVFPGATINIINYLLAIVHVPVNEITINTIRNLGYNVMPVIRGPISHQSLEASGVTRLRNIPAFNLRGQGVLIAIIDSGIDYTNKVFQYADGTTRIAALWDQTIISDNPPQDLAYGTEYTREQINQALQSDNPFDIVPSRDDTGHGTMVAGVAGGTEIVDQDFYGVAPDVEFVVVKLKQAKQYLRDFFCIPEGAVCYQDTDIFFAFTYLANKLKELARPMVICLALGSSQGPHDGREFLAQYLSLFSTRHGVAMIIAAGNEGNSRRHYEGIVNRVTGYDTVELFVGENQGNFLMELWGRSPSAFSVEITSPSGEVIPPMGPGIRENREVTFVFEPTRIIIDFLTVEVVTGNQLILFRFFNPVPGIWRFRVYERGDLNLPYNIWLPMNGFISDETYFIRSNPYTTVLNPGNAEIPITVTAYNITDDSLYPEASRGFSTAGGVVPDIAAPGVNITAPTIDGGFREFSGTSVAAAHTAGIAALLLEWGVVRGNLPRMSTIEMRKLLIRGARRDASLDYPNRDWGYGILDIYNVFDSLRTGIIV